MTVDKQTVFEQILQELVAEGEYEAALLSDSDGLALAVVGTEESAAMMAAMTALLGDSARQARWQLDLVYVNELSLVSDDRFRLVCRFFETESGQPLALTLIVPPDQAYRRLTNQALSQIKTAWPD